MKKVESLSLEELLKLGNEIRKKYMREEFELCSITNAKSGLCSEDCKFCAQSRKYKTGAKIYRMKEEEIIMEEARRAKKMKAKRFGIVASGKKVSREEVKKVANVGKKIKEKIGIKVCASLGMIEEEELQFLKDNGISRYHHNIETSERFFPKIVTTHSFSERVKTIEKAKKVGLEVCSGGIIGMGEEEADRIAMAELLNELEVKSVAINILVPIKGTPLEGVRLLSIKEILRTIALFRVILKDKIIKIAAGREAILKEFEVLAFMGGANGMIIGDYLTLKGRKPEEDLKLIAGIKELWNG